MSGDPVDLKKNNNFLFVVFLLHETFKIIFHRDISLTYIHVYFFLSLAHKYVTIYMI